MDDLFPDDWIAASIECDIKAIANDEFFNTPEKVRAEVERRLAGIERTLRIARNLERWA